VASNDLYLVTLFGQIFGQQTVNTFTYTQLTEETSPDVSAEVLANAFYGAFLGASGVLNGTAFSTAQSYNAIRVLNLFDDVSDFFEMAISPVETGATAGATMPPYVTYAFRTPWLGLGVRRGQKRFSGVLETEVNNGVLQPAVLATLEDVQGALGQQLIGSSGTYNPVIVRRVKTLDPDTGKYVYSLPSNPTQLFQVGAPSWSAVQYSSTQNSRKYGRGS